MTYIPLTIISSINKSKIDLHDLIIHWFEPIFKMYVKLGQHDLVKYTLVTFCLSRSC